MQVLLADAKETTSRCLKIMYTGVPEDSDCREVFVHRQTSNQWPTHGRRLVMHHVVFYTGNYILNIFFKSRIKRTRKMEVVGDDEEHLASIFDQTATRVGQPLRLGQYLGSESQLNRRVS